MWGSRDYITMTMKKDARPRGRPRTFDEADVLDIAKDLFWQQGYEGTSIKDLTLAMRMTPPSLYAAFDSKQSLYRRVLDRYVETFGQLLLAGLFDEPDLKKAISHVVHIWAELLTSGSHPKGCMISLGMANHAPEHASVAQDLAARREQTSGLILDRLNADKDQLPDGTDLPGLANYFAMAIQGMSMQARDGMTTRDMLRVADRVMAAWPV
jgi:TetR/AcrR family transcriptional regulator, copper-responsive repressor